MLNLWLSDKVSQGHPTQFDWCRTDHGGASQNLLENWHLEAIMTEQGSNFTLQLLTELYMLPHIHSMWTACTLLPRNKIGGTSNKTLKELLPKTTADIGKDRNNLIPFLVLCLKVPLARTIFYPISLLYEKPVWRALDNIKEAGEVSKSCWTNLIEQTAGEVEGNIPCRWYGEWIRLTIYLMRTTPNTQKRKRVHYVNILKRWQAPVATTFLYWAGNVQPDYDYPVSYILLK